MSLTPFISQSPTGWTKAMIDHLTKVAPLLLPSHSPSLGRHLLLAKSVKAGQVLCEEPVPVFFHVGGVNVDTLLKGQAKVRASFPFFDNLYAKQNDAQRRLFQEMTNMSDADYLTIKRMETNGFDAGSAAIGLSLFVAMASHACQPTASYGVGTWTADQEAKNQNVLRAVATRDLGEGEEVTIRYGRCADMPDRYGFHPTCVGACETDRLDTLYQTEFLDSLRAHPPTGEMISL